MMDKLNEKYIKLKRILAALIFINALFSLYIYHLSNKDSVSNLNKAIYKTYVETEGGSGNYTVYSSNVFPTEGYALNTTLSTCTNGGSVSQGEDYSITYIGSPGSCTLYFDVDDVQTLGGAVSTILNLVGDADDTSTAAIGDTPLAYDGTADKNLRYIGEDEYRYQNGTYTIIYQVNNYIDIGDTSSLWRIIGVFNNIDDGTGKKETRLKIVRAESLGKYSWDTSASSTNSGYGINQWGPSGSYEGADLMRELNGDYLNPSLSSNTTWYNGRNNNLNATFDKTKSLSLSAQSLIGNALWHTGAVPDNLTASEIYQYERGTLTGKNCSSGNYCNDTVTRTTTWIGKIALPHVSDYAYTTTGYIKEGLTRESCLNANVDDWYCDDDDGDEGYCMCSVSWIDYIAYENESIDFLNPEGLNTSESYVVMKLDGTGKLGGSDSAYNNIIEPTAFLKSNVTITGGTGTKTDPYIATLP